MKVEDVRKVEKNEGCFSTNISINDTDIVDLYNEEVSSLIEDIILNSKFIATQIQEFKDSLSEILDNNGYSPTEDAEIIPQLKSLLEEQEVFSKEEEDLRLSLGEILIDYFYGVLNKTHEDQHYCGQCGDYNSSETWEK